MKDSTLCVGANVHLDKADGHEVTEHFRVTHNLPGAKAAAATVAQLAKRLATPVSRSAGSRPRYGYLRYYFFPGANRLRQFNLESLAARRGCSAGDKAYCCRKYHKLAPSTSPLYYSGLTAGKIAQLVGILACWLQPAC